jgi:hypothetical protein
MRWIALGLLSLLVGCAGGQVLPSGTPHNEGASLITPTGSIPMSVQPLYNQGKDDVWISIASGGTWVTEGDFLFRDCFTILDGDQPVKRVHVAPGRHYMVGCDKSSNVTFVDIGPVPAE